MFSFSEKKFILIPLIGTGLCVFLAMLFSQVWGINEDVSIWLYILFWIPIIIGIAGWLFITSEAETIRKTDSKNIKAVKRFRKFYACAMTSSTLSYAILWLVFTLDAKFLFPPFISSFASFLCLIVILGHVLVILAITYVVMEPTRSIKILSDKNFKKGLDLFPFWRFALFFSIFLCVSYLFGFAFAFHDLSYVKQKLILDKIQNKRSLAEEIDRAKFTSVLYVEELRTTRELKRRIAQKKLDRVIETNPQELKERQGLGCFYFESGRANFIANDKTEELKNYQSNEALRYLVRKNTNFKQMGKVLSRIKQIEDEKLVQIILISRTDDKKINDTYSSNYELSEARAEIVKSKLISAILSSTNYSLQRISWLIIPLSDEKTKNRFEKSKNNNQSQENCSPLIGDKHSDKRVVEVYVNEISEKEKLTLDNEFLRIQINELKTPKYKIRPDLMDYIYFPISKGYGDIRPVSNYAKFLDTLDNFFEVFFLVIFMNALIGLKKGS